MLELFAGDVEVGEAGRWAVVALLFVLGAVLGSFMNVVIYRLPRGMSLVRPGSQCPHCEQLIRWYDNMPIIGWLLLFGRCRDCGMRISPRYPLVELLVGAYSAALAWVQVAQPLVQLAADAPPLFVLDFGPYVLDMLVVCTLFCAAAIELEGLIVPQWLLSFTLVVGITLTTLWPQWQIDAAAGQWLLRGVPESVPGVLAALWLALLTWPAFIGTGGSRGIMNAASAAGELAIVGIYLGLWAAIALGVASMALLVVARLIALAWPAMARAGLAVWLTVATVPWVVASRPASGYLARWIVEREWPALLGAGALAAVLALIARWLDRSPHAASGDRG